VRPAHPERAIAIPFSRIELNKVVAKNLAVLILRELAANGICSFAPKMDIHTTKQGSSGDFDGHRVRNVRRAWVECHGMCAGWPGTTNLIAWLLPEVHLVV